MGLPKSYVSTDHAPTPDVPGIRYALLGLELESPDWLDTSHCAQIANFRHFSPQRQSQRSENGFDWRKHRGMELPTPASLGPAFRALGRPVRRVERQAYFNHTERVQGKRFLPLPKEHPSHEMCE